MEEYNFDHINDETELTREYLKFVAPIMEKHENRVKPFEDEFRAFAKPYQDAHDEACGSITQEFENKFAPIEKECTKKMEDIRKEALRRINRIEEKLVRAQEKLQNEYNNHPVIAAETAKFKKAIADAQQEYDEKYQISFDQMKQEIAPFEVPYMRKLHELQGKLKIVKYDPRIEESPPTNTLQ